MNRKKKKTSVNIPSQSDVEMFYKQIVESTATRKNSLEKLYKQSHKLGFSRGKTRAIFDILVKNSKIEINPNNTVTIKQLETKKGKYYPTSRDAGEIISQDDKEVYVVSSNDFLYSMLYKSDTVEFAFDDQTKKATVVSIVERGISKLVGRLENHNNFAFFIPNENIGGRDPIVEFDDTKGAKENDIVVVQIYQWPTDISKSKNVRTKAKVIKIIGKIGDPDSEIKAILHKNEVKENFTKTIETKIENMTFPKPEELLDRRDIRNEKIFTVDPYDAKDFDDAIHVKEFDTHYEVGVHIADVSHYVLPDDEVDKEAYKRGNSIYLVDRVIPMLPELLCNDLCSLKPNVDRLSFSVVVKLDKTNCDIISWEFFKSVIHSCCRFNYEEINEIMENEADYTEHFLHKEIMLSKKIALKLVEKTVKRGYINFSMPEIKVKLDEKGYPCEIGVKKPIFSNKMIEVFMLLANECAAKHVKEKKYDAIFRVHDKPEYPKVLELINFLGGFGIDIHISQKMHPSEFQKILDEIKDSPFEYMVNDHLLRTMQKAVYSPEDKGHFGLSLKDYTHFTSPIRRYCDLVVHRIIQDSLEKKVSCYNFGLLYEISKHISDTERTAMVMERESIKIKLMQYVSSHIGVEYDGIVSGTIQSGLFVQIENLLIEGMVTSKMLNKDEDDVVYSSTEKCFVSKKWGTLYPGRRVRIKVHSVNIEKKQIDFELVSAINEKSHKKG